MSEEFKENRLEIYISELHKLDLTVSGREECWGKVVNLIKFGISNHYKENQCSSLIQLIFIPESEESYTIRRVSFEVFYHLMLCQSQLINSVINQFSNEIFQHLLFNSASESSEVRLVSEQCMLRLLTNVLPSLEALNLVIQQFVECVDPTIPDLLKPLDWVIDRIPRQNLHNEILSDYLEGLKKHLGGHDTKQNSLLDGVYESFEERHGDLEGLCVQRLRLISNKLASKTTENFRQLLHQILNKSKRRSKQRLPNQNKVMVFNDGLNKFSKLSPICSSNNNSRPRSASSRKSNYFF